MTNPNPNERVSRCHEECALLRHYRYLHEGRSTVEQCETLHGIKLERRLREERAGKEHLCCALGHQPADKASYYYGLAGQTVHSLNFRKRERREKKMDHKLTEVAERGAQQDATPIIAETRTSPAAPVASGGAQPKFPYNRSTYRLLQYYYRPIAEACGYEVWDAMVKGCADSRTEGAAGPSRQGIYFSSKTKHAGKWRAVRAAGVPVISTWIDEAGEGEPSDFADLWRRNISEAASAEKLIVYAEPGDVLKGALIEVGAALAGGVPVVMVGDIEPMKTAVNHTLVTRAESIEAAIGWPSSYPPPTSPSPSENATTKTCGCNIFSCGQCFPERATEKENHANADSNSSDSVLRSGRCDDTTAAEEVAPAGEAEARRVARDIMPLIETHEHLSNYHREFGDRLTQATALILKFASHVSTQKEAALTLAHSELLSLTPGGSEFVNDPQRCAAFAREQLSFLGTVARERNELRVALFGARTRIRELEAVRCPQCKHLMRFHDNVDDTHGCLQCAKDAALAAKDKEIAQLKAVILGTNAATDRALTALLNLPEQLQADVDQAKKLVNASNKGEQVIGLLVGAHAAIGRWYLSKRREVLSKKESEKP